MKRRSSYPNGNTSEHSSHTQALNEVKLEDSYLHWYKNHPSSLHGKPLRIHTDEPENEYLPGRLTLPINYCSKCYSFNPYVSSYRSLKRIRTYRHKIQGIFEDIYGYMRWADLPGGQHLTAIDKNYLLNYVWMITYAANEIDVSNKDAVRHLRYRFEDLLYQAENLGIILQKFFGPLQILAQNEALVDEMAEMIETTRKFTWLNSERKIMRLTIRPDSTIFTGNSVSDFNKLIIYARKDCQSWTRFQTLSEADKVDIVSKGLMEINEKLKELKRKLKRPLRELRAAKRECCLCFRRSLIPHMKRLRDNVKQIIEQKEKGYSTNENDMEKEKSLIEAFYLEASSHYQYILRYGELLVEELWDVILMVRLGYGYIKESPHSNIMVASYEAVINSKFKPSKRRKLLKYSNFKQEDFFKFECPEILRRLPILVSPINAEMCLHLQGHRNNNKSHISSTPVHKFSMKRWNSETLEKAGVEAASPGPNRKTLVFVSGEGDL